MKNKKAFGSSVPKTMKPKQLFLKRELKKCDFGVAIFGSARVKMNQKSYALVFQLAKKIGMHGYDLITGGGPGLMEAAAAGHTEGDKLRRADLIGLTIRLPFEQSVNRYLELRKHFSTFSSRLEYFMALSNVLVVTQGGIGTMLELFFTWQLMQVKHIEFKPIILVGRMWEELIVWMKKYMLRENLVSKEDFHPIYIARTVEEAMKIIDEYHEKYEKEGKCAWKRNGHRSKKSYRKSKK